MTRDTNSPLPLESADTVSIGQGQGLSMLDVFWPHQLPSRIFRMVICRGIAPLTDWTAAFFLKLEKEVRDKCATCHLPRQPFDPSRVIVLPHQHHSPFMTENESCFCVHVTALRAHTVFSKHGRLAQPRCSLSHCSFVLPMR